MNFFNYQALPGANQGPSTITDQESNGYNYLYTLLPSQNPLPSSNPPPSHNLPSQEVPAFDPSMGFPPQDYHTTEYWTAHEERRGVREKAEKEAQNDEDQRMNNAAESSSEDDDDVVVVDPKVCVVCTEAFGRKRSFARRDALKKHYSSGLHRLALSKLGKDSPAVKHSIAEDSSARRHPKKSTARVSTAEAAGLRKTTAPKATKTTPKNAEAGPSSNRSIRRSNSSGEL